MGFFFTGIETWSIRSRETLLEDGCHPFLLPVSGSEKVDTSGSESVLILSWPQSQQSPDCSQHLGMIGKMYSSFCLPQARCVHCLWVHGMQETIGIKHGFCLLTSGFDFSISYPIWKFPNIWSCQFVPLEYSQILSCLLAYVSFYRPWSSFLFACWPCGLQSHIISHISAYAVPEKSSAYMMLLTYAPFTCMTWSDFILFPMVL